MTAPSIRRAAHICIRCAALDPEDQPPRPRPAPHGRRDKYCSSCWRAKQSEDSAKRHLAYVQKTYGLQPGEYEAMYELQGGRCAICQIATGKTRRLAVDHDHETGSPRGLLCNNCNKVVLGFGGQILARAMVYLNDPPYAQLKREQRED